MDEDTIYRIVFAISCGVIRGMNAGMVSYGIVGLKAWDGEHGIPACKDYYGN